MKSGVIPSLAARLVGAKKLREWCRFNLLAIDVSKESRAAPKKGNHCKKENSGRVSSIVQNHKIIDAFFEDIGFPALPKDHSLHRQWEAQLEAVRRAEKRQGMRRRRRPAPSATK